MKVIKSQKFIVYAALAAAVLLCFEFILPNYVSRFGKTFIADLGAGVKVPTLTTKRDAQSHWQANEFLFSFQNVPMTETKRVAGFIYHKEQNTFDVLQQNDTHIFGQNLANFLETHGLQMLSYTQESGGLKQLIEVHDERFILTGLRRNACVFAALVSTKSMTIAGTFPCLPTDEVSLNFNGIGGGYSVVGDQLFLSVGTPSGDLNDRISQLAQDPTSPYGKVLRYDIEIGADGIHLAHPTIFSSGHRNPQGMLSMDGQLLAVEHGPKGGDEINIIVKGRNYGWPNYSLGSGYDDEDLIGFPPAQMAITNPMFSFTPSIGISDLSQCPTAIANRYAGADCLLVSSLIGEAFFLLLGDFKNKQIISVEKMEVDARIREITVIDDVLYLVTDYQGILQVNIDPT